MRIEASEFVGNSSGFELPQDYVEFVQAGRQLEYDLSKCQAGRVELRALEQLKPCEVFAEAGQSFADYDEIHGGELGEYAIPAVSLARSDESWLNPNSVLLWYPAFHEFGQWSSEERIAYRFAGISWPQISRRPLAYLNAMWNPKRRGMGKIITKIRPWGEAVEGARFVDRDYAAAHSWPKS